MQCFGEADGGAIHEHLGILQALGVQCKVGLDDLGVIVDFFEGSICAVIVSVGDLLDGHDGHGMDELGVEIALVARIGLPGLNFHLGERLGVRDGVIRRCGVDRRGWGKEQNWDKEECEGPGRHFHSAPRRSVLLTHELEGDEAVAGLPFLIWKLSSSHGEELIVEVGCKLDLVKLVVRSRSEEQTRR